MELQIFFCSDVGTGFSPGKHLSWRIAKFFGVEYSAVDLIDLNELVEFETSAIWDDIFTTMNMVAAPNSWISWILRISWLL